MRHRFYVGVFVALMSFLWGIASSFAQATNSNSTTNAHPQTETRTLSLRQCVDLSLNRNLDLKIEHLKVEMAGAALNGAYGVYIPTLTAGATHSYKDQPGALDPEKVNPYFPTELTTETLGADLSGTLPYGFSYKFLEVTRKIESDTDFRADPGNAVLFPGGIRSTNDASASVGVLMRQHLLKDFWIDADQEQLMIRRANLKVSLQAFRFQVMQTLLAVDMAYYDLIAAREEIAVQQKAVELREQFVDDTRRRIALGESPASVSAQAQTQLQNSLVALAAARQNFSLRQNKLIGLLTDDFKSWVATELQPGEELQANPVDLNRSDSFQKALSTRPDLLEARLAVEKSNVTVKYRFNQLFPSLDLVGGYGGLGNPSDSTTGSKALGEAFGFSNPEYSYGAVVSVPLSNLTDRNNYRSSLAAKKVAQLELQKAEQEVLIDVADCITRVETCFNQVDFSRKAAGFAAEALEAEKTRLQNGATTGFAVLQYQEILTQARTAEIRAKVDYNKAVARMAFAEGSIFQLHHLNLDAN